MVVQPLGNPGLCHPSSTPMAKLMIFCSPLIEGAWAGHLLHLSGLDVIGSTTSSLSRMVQDHEIELWEGKRIVGDASPEEVCQPLFCYKK